MKNKGYSKIAFVIMSVFVFFLVADLSAKNVEEVEGPKLEFVKEAEELGEIKVNELEEYNLEIEFVNSGNEPLILSQVRGCCGTRIMEWPREPISPGDKGIIKVKFRLAPRPHNVSRVVTVLSNEPAGQKVFRIKGKVVKAEEDVFNGE